MNYGLLQGVVEKTAYFLGDQKIPYIPYNETGDWEKYLPKYEPQAEYYETSGCTVWGTQNQIETFENFLFDKEPNYAERFNYLLAGVHPKMGADPQIVYENVRACGVVDNKYLKMPRTLNEFLDKSDITGSLLAKGLFWLQQYEFRHEWLWNGTQPADKLEILKQMLKTSPVAVSVTAWNKRDGLYVDLGKMNNHWCLCYRVDDGGIHVFDSYDNSRKVLAHNHYIRMAKRIWINKRTRPALKMHVKILNSILELLMNKKTLVSVCAEHIGKDASPNDAAPDELACADTVSNLLNLTYGGVPTIVSTIKLNEYLSNPKNGFKRVQEVAPGVIIVSPTEGTKVGHTGIYMEDEVIASNDSGLVVPGNKGKFFKNYTTETWARRYTQKLGLKTYLYARA